MRILILGTSNSILKDGYVAGLKSSLSSATFINYSSGASPGLQFLKYMRDDFKVFDLVIFDSVPNDEQYGLRTKGYKYDTYYRQMLFEMFSTISAETRLIVVSIALRNFLDKQSKVYSDREVISNLAGAQFIDFSEALSLYNTIDPDVYSEHPAHPKSALAFKIGAYLGESIKKNLEKIPRMQLCKTYRHNFYVDEKHIINAGAMKRNYKNSFMSAEYLEMLTGQSLKIDGSKKLIGFFVNASKTNASIQFTNKKQESIRANLFYRRKNEGFLNLFFPMQDYQHITSITVQDSPSNTPTFRPRLTQESRDSQEQILNLGSLIFWESNEKNAESTLSKQYNHRFLTEIISKKIKKELVDVP